MTRVLEAVDKLMIDIILITILLGLCIMAGKMFDALRDDLPGILWLVISGLFIFMAVVWTLLIILNHVRIPYLTDRLQQFFDTTAKLVPGDDRISEPEEAGISANATVTSDSGRGSVMKRLLGYAVALLGLAIVMVVAINFPFL